MAPSPIRITPSNKHGRPVPEPIPLHALDFIVPPVYVRLHLFFPPNDLDTTVERLKESLAETLELYPPVAGSLEPLDGHLHLVSNGRGADLYYETRDTPYTELPDGDSEDLSPRALLAIGDTGPLMAAKVTQFSCGTLAIAVSINHKIGDFAAIYDFIATWASITRGDATPAPPPPKSFERSPASYFPKDFAPRQRFPGFNILPSFPEGGPPMPGPVAQYILAFDAKSLADLKAASTPKDDPSVSWVSTGDALSALLWRSITRARVNSGVPVADVVEVTIAADARERSNGKAMVGQYFANCNIAITAQLERELLLDISALPAAAVALRRAVSEQLTSEWIASKLAYLEGVKPPAMVILTADQEFTNWSRYRLAGQPALDFGWGAPLVVLPGGYKWPPGRTHIMERAGHEGEFRVVIAVEEQAGDSLRNDQELWKYGKLIR